MQDTVPLIELCRIQLQYPHCVSNCLQHVRSSGRHEFVYMSCATWYEGTAQIISLTELKSHFLKKVYVVG